MRRLLLLALLCWPGLAAAEADLGVAIADSPDPVAAGGALLYGVTVVNHGPNGATGVQLVDVMPENVTFASVQVLTDQIFSDGFESGSTAAWGASGGSPCGVAGRIVTCSLGAISAGASVLVKLNVTVSGSAAGQLSNSATVGGSSTDSTPGNDTATATTTVATANADLALSISDAPDPVAVGQLLTYTLRVGNLGPNAATGIELQDALPPEVGYVSSSGACFADEGLVTCSLADLASGTNTAVTITVLVGEDAVFAITNPAAVASSSTDGNPGNDQDTEITTVNP